MKNEIAVAKIICKNCGSTAVVKFGKYKNTQLYCCKDCKRKFRNNDCDFHKKVPTVIVRVVLSLHDAGKGINSIRNCLKNEFGYCPSKATVHKWILR